MTSTYCFERALLPSGWGNNVLVEISNDGNIACVAANATNATAKQVSGVALPGMPNLHCHAFQKGMAGLAERRGPANDSFWTWREVMYRFLNNLTPEDVESISTFAYVQMLERGFTRVGEFHYLHHDVCGEPYSDIAEMTSRIAAASVNAGIGLTLLPCLYTYGGFKNTPPHPGQRRFLNSTDRFAKIMERSRDVISTVQGANLGIAPHSLRAVSPEQLRILTNAFPHIPAHIHAAEQTKEVDDCIAALGTRPIRWLLDHMAIDQRWCLIHATHMTTDETRDVAKAGVVAGLCPLTEGSLGDGTFDGVSFLDSNGRFGLGTDSNIEINAPGELRQLEYSQRLKHRARNVMTTMEGESTGRSLYDNALRGGARALGGSVGSIEVGCRADILVLNSDHPDLAGASGDLVLDIYIFSGGAGLIDLVIAGGDLVVEGGRHRARDEIVSKYRKTVARLAQT